MGSLLIATGIFIYTWISGIHYSFLRQRSSQKATGPSDLMIKALIWPMLHLTQESSPELGELLD